MIQLIDNWRQCLKLASVQVYVLIAAMPDIYNAIAVLGWVEQLPGPAMWTVRGLAASGIAARIIKQKSVEVKNGL